MIKMKNKFVRERNVEKLAREYFRIAGVTSLAELKKTIYWNYYEEEKRMASKQNSPIDEKSVKENKEIYKCINCEKIILEKKGDNYLINVNLLASLKENIKIKCSCGKVNIIEKK